MSTVLLKNLLSPIRQFAAGVGNCEQMTGGAAVLPVDPAKVRRTQAALRMAAYLVSRLEKMDHAPAVNELHKLSPEDRVFVAEKMLWINKQHRSIITSLPRFNCSFKLLNDGRKDLEFIYINYVGAQGSTTNNTFCFR